MSSKSKKQTQHKSAAHAKTEAPTQGAAGAHDEEHHLTEKVEEVLYVPTGKSPMRFLLIVLLVIVLTAIFAINPSTIFQATSGAGEVFLTWDHPTQGRVEILGQEFLMTKRDLALFGSRPTDEDTARHLVLAGLAESAGVRVTDAELADRLRELAASAGDVVTLKQFMRQASGGIRGFEELIRDQLEGQRYMQLLAYFAALPTPDAVEEAWREDHQELAYDYVELEVSALLEDARQEIPSDEELEAWLGEMEELDQAEFEEPERMRAELVGYLFEGDNDAAELLARYPDPGHGDDEDVPEHDHGADLARAYYDRVLYWRFARPVEEGEEPAVDFQARYFDFEEVADQARAEAPIHAALERWMGDLRERTDNGEEIDLESAALELGLSYRPAVDTLSAEEWGEVAGWGGTTLGARLARLQPSEVSPVLMVESGVMAVGRLAERAEAYLPEFQLVRDDLAEAWAEDRAAELVVERLVEVRDSFEPLPTADEEDPEDEELLEDEPLPHATDGEFSEAVAGLRLELMRRPFMERTAAYTADPDLDVPGHVYIRSNPSLVSLEEGEIAEPSLDPAGERAYLVRCAGRRPAEEWKITPSELDQSVRRAGFEAYSEYLEANFAFEALVDKYAIDMPRDEEPEDAPL